MRNRQLQRDAVARELEPAREIGRTQHAAS
jgi:hypothetical protein